MSALEHGGLHLEPLRPFGLAIHGIDAALRGLDAAALRHCLADHGVVVLRDLRLSADGFVGLLRALGPMTFTVGEAPSDAHPWLNTVTNVGRRDTPRSVWHADTTYVSKPPQYTGLMPLELPEQGGDTVFAHLGRTYKRLPAHRRRALDGVELEHRASRVSVEPGDQDHAWHPLVARHPVNHEPTLYLTAAERMGDLRHPHRPVAASLAQELLAMATAPAVVYRHRWRPGDIVIWDNRCTLHRADHDDVLGARTFLRGLVAGDAPCAHRPAAPSARLESSLIAESVNARA